MKLSQEERLALRNIIDYMWDEEERHYEESGKPKHHIFQKVKLLRDSIDKNKVKVLKY